MVEQFALGNSERNEGGEGTRLIIDSSEYPDVLQVPRGMLADEVEVVALPQDSR